MYLLVILTLLSLDKTLAKPSLEMKKCLRNLCGCLFNHVKVEISAHTAKCLGSALREYAGKVYSRFASIKYYAAKPMTAWLW